MSLADQQWCPTSVQVTVLQARGLRIKGKSGTNDAYAVMQVGKEKFQTSVVEKSVAPVWKEEAAFDLPPLLHGAHGSERGTLHVHVLHRALVGPDKLLGQAVINLLQLSEDKTRSKTEWFKLLDKTGKPDKDRGEVLLDIQFMRNNMTASMFDLSAAGKSRSRLGKLKDKVRGKKKESDSGSNTLPSFTQVLTDSEEEANGGEVAPSKDGKKKHKMKSLFSPKSNLQKNMSQSMSVLPGKNSTLSGSQSSGLNVDSSEGKKKFKFKIHKRSGSSDSKDPSSGLQKQLPAEQSNLCINGSHIYCEEPPTRTSRIGSNFSLASSGHGSMEEVPENSPPSVDSLRAVRQYSPWTEEEEEEVENIKEDESRRMEEEEEEKVRRQQEELERLAEEEERRRVEEEKVKREEEERIRRQEEEECERLAEEKRRLEEQERKKIEEENQKRQREEEEKIRMEEERAQEERRRRQEEEERVRREEERKLAAEKRRLEEEERRIEEEERRRREEEERAEEEERVRKEKEEYERLMEEKRKLEDEKKRIEAEERRKRMEEERMRKEEQDRKQREEEEMRRQEEEERVRKEREEYERLMEEKRKVEDEKKRIEAEERIRKEEEERARMEEELRRQEEEERVRKEKEEYERLMEEKRKLEEEKERTEAEEKLRKEEEERIRMEEERMREEEKRRQEEEERMQREEEERIRKEELRRQEEEEKARKEKEEYERLMEEKRKVEDEKKRIEAEERIRKEEEERVRMEEEMRREEEEERVRKEKEEYERLVEEKRKLEEEKERIKAEEKLRKEEEERIRMEEERRKEEEEKRRREEQERIRVEEEKRQKEEEERRRKEEERARKEKEEYERLEEERRKEEEQRRRIEEEERIRKEEQEKIKMEEEEKKRQEEEERARKEKEEMERLEEERQRKEEQEKRRIEEEERMRRERKQKEEARRLEIEKLKRDAEERKKTENKDGQKAAGKKSKLNSSAEVYSTNPFDENYSYNPFEEIPDSPPGAREETVQQRCQSAVSSLGSKTVPTDEKELVSSQREKRPAPQPPGRNQAEKPSQREQDASARHPGQINTQNKDKDLKTASVPPQRSVQVIVPVGRSPADSKNGESLTQTGKHSKRPAPPRPRSVEEEPKTTSTAETKQTVYGLNPFEDDEDENDAGPACWPPAADKDAASQTKTKSLKVARAPPPPQNNSTLITQNTEGGGVADDTVPDGPANKACDPQPEAVNPTLVQESPVQNTVEACVKKEGPPVAARRLQPVKPLNSVEQQSVSVVQGENKSTGTHSEAQDKAKVNDTGLKGPFSQLTQEELISLVLKQENQLSERDKKISELEQYIDNLLVRVIEEQPSILMSINSLKKAA